MGNCDLGHTKKEVSEMILAMAQAGQSIDKMFSRFDKEELYSRKNIRIMIELRQTLTRDGFIFNHDIANQAFRNYYKREAGKHDRYLTASIRCENKGHDWRIRSQAEWNKGYDEPVHCQRCGAWDM